MNKTLEIAMTSPALEWQSDSKSPFTYPAHFKGRVPLKVIINKTVKADFSPFNKGKQWPIANCGDEYHVWVNSYGAVTAILEDGQRLGLKPDEFTVTQWHEAE